MKKIFNFNAVSTVLSVFALLYMSLSGCSMPAKPTHSNPNDPDNPDFVGPAVEIISPAEGFSINSGTAVIYLHGYGSAYEYSYKLDGDVDWNSWQTDTVITLSNLSEGSHNIQAVARDAGGYIGTPTPTRGFSINQFFNTILIYPPTQTIAVGETAEVWFEMEEVSTSISAIDMVFYVSGYWYADTISAQSDTGYHWIANGGSPMGPFYTNYNNWSNPAYVEVSLGVAGGSPAGVSGTGRIFKTKMLGVDVGTTAMYIYNLTVRDTLNNAVSISPPSPTRYAYITVSSSKEGVK
jgi:hypothetical protein